MADIREPSVAGVFYPADPKLLEHWVGRYVRAAASLPMDAKAVIAPHAGYAYSGPVAGSAYAAVRHLAGTIARVVLMAPAHRVGFAGLAVPSAALLATPIGTVAVDRDAIQSGLAEGLLHVRDAAFDGEHAVEVQLPFLRHTLGEVRVLPLLVGCDTRPEQVDAVLARFWGGPETLIVISSDLSHYHDYETAVRRDLATARALEVLQPEQLSGGCACGHVAIAGLLRRAAALDLRLTTLDLRNSGDTAGDRDRVVGYGAFVLEYAATARLPAPLREVVHDAARQALAHAATHEQPAEVNPGTFPMPLRALRRTFVTLETRGHLRGCIGSLTATNPLIVDVVLNTLKAARTDPRFPAVGEEEVGEVTVAISILSHPRPIRAATEAELAASIQPDVEGLILGRGGQFGLFLPKVWRDLPNPLAFLRNLKVKAGIPADYFGSDLKAYRFTAEVF